MSPKDKLIVALDLPNAAEALEMVARLDGSCRWVKVGLELYLAAGNAIVEKLTAQGLSVFLDLKLHDIPNTVAGAIASASSTGASLLTIHTAGGPKMLAAAVEAVAKLANPPQLLGVTVLTSMDAAQLQATGVATSLSHHVLTLATMATSCGINGFVTSPLEVALLRNALGPTANLVIPGIRPDGAAIGDQSRIATPKTAITDGASMLVVGRPITQAANPAAAARAVLEEIDAAACITSA